MTNALLPIIPESITVHLGAPTAAAQNITVSFPEYIKNVASSEIYPTWPENAIRANVLAQISYTLNRVYTEYYRSRGYDFDITNSTAFDHSFVPGRNIFENVSQIVDEIFTNYISRRGSVEPLFAAYCDGIRVTCDGLSQWGTVDLAEQGLTPYEILRYYYGDDIDIVYDANVENVDESFPGVNLSLGTVGNDVAFFQRRLNRISRNYPSIPKISAPIGIFNEETDAAVREFQRIFNLTSDGIVGRATWYKIALIYNAVKRVSELTSEGIPLEDVTDAAAQTISEGDTGTAVQNLQFFLNFIGNFDPVIPSVEIDGIFGPATRASVEAFQEQYGLPVTGEMRALDWNTLYRAYRGILSTLPEGYLGAQTEPYPGVPLTLGSQGDDVRTIQEYLNLIAKYYPEIPTLTVDGVFGPATLDAVNTFERLFGLEVLRALEFVTWTKIAEIYRSLRDSEEGSAGQYGGEITDSGTSEG